MAAGAHAIGRREFLAALSAAVTLAGWEANGFSAEDPASLPRGSAPPALEASWFPSRLHAYVWRNWSLLSTEKLGAVIGAKGDDIARVGMSLGLEPGPVLDDQTRRRANLTIIRRNWHLLPYDQLLRLLDWSVEELAYTLREDDFFFHKLGLLKPQVEPLRWVEPDEGQRARAAEIARIVHEVFPQGQLTGREPPFAFVDHLSSPAASVAPPADWRSAPLRLGYSYFALYGDPLVDPALDPYPNFYLARLADVGVNAVWLQGVLARLSPLPWAKEEHIEQRRVALRALVERAAKHGIRVFLYLNEPRCLPTSSPVFVEHPEWRGVPDQDFHTVCTSNVAVRDALRDAVADLCRAVPGLGGFLTITASENPTNCWSHGRGAMCPRCRERTPATVIAEVVSTFWAGIEAARGDQRLLAWDWGWAEAWGTDVIRQLPAGVTLMSVSEWSLPIERGGVKSVVGEYCLSVTSPGPRAKRHWQAAQERGLSVAAKLQFGVTWEIAAIPYLPVLDNICQHTAALRDLGVQDLMLGWTLGGHPSPNIEAVREIMDGGTLDSLAEKRHGRDGAAAMAKFWRAASAAFREFPYNIGTVYSAPLQVGPANPLWPEPTKYHACMVGIPYDDLDAWRSVFPPEVFASQLDKVSAGFEAALAQVRAAIPDPTPQMAEEWRFLEAAAIHFASVANQCRFVVARRADDRESMTRVLRAEELLAARLHRLRSDDSRLGFEASNQYFYTPLDLVEKVVNCRWLRRP